MLDISKAVNLLNWRPILNVDEAIECTVNWYKTPDVGYDFCVSQISDYVDRSVQRQGMSGNES